MTYQEAKERFSKERPYLVNHDWKIAYYLAEQALEKQIPKKPTGNNLNCCPSCKGLVGINTDVIHAKYNYCNHCGQAIDWSD